MRKLGGDRAGTVAAGRFLANDKVTPDEIFAAAGAACAAKVGGSTGDLIAIQDTCHLSYPGRPLGPGGDGTVPGLFVHPVLAVDAADGTALGLVAGEVWTRQPGKVANRKVRAIEDKESRRWLQQGLAARAVLSGARHVTLIADRESDIYEAWALLPVPGRFDLISRARSDRRLAPSAAAVEDEVEAAASAAAAPSTLFAALAQWPVAGCTRLALPARADRARRCARLALKFGEVEIAKPTICRSKQVARSLTLRVVEVCEVGAPADVEPIHWRLLTTLPVDSLDDAFAVIDRYRQRWRIEEYFRVLKRSGMDLEGARLEGAHALLNLVAMGAVAAVPVMTLVEGRAAGPERRAASVIGPDALRFAAALCATLEGRTDQQRNPHPPESLAWLSWIIGRLGGWSGYTRYGPPGPKTMADGWHLFRTMHHGWTLR